MTVDAPPVQRPIDYPGEWPPGSGRFGPNPRQEVAHAVAPYADELLFGGARGGGKTTVLLAECLRRCLQVPGFQAVFFRRTYRELSGPGGAIPRLMVAIPPSVGRWRETDRTWTFYNGSVLTLTYLESAKDVQAWLGLEVQLMAFDQVEQLDEQVYVLVRTSLRVTGTVAARMRELGLRPSAIASANPGGRGHVWVKRRFVDEEPLGVQMVEQPDGTMAAQGMFRAAPTEDEPAPLTRAFVPSRLDDNPALSEGDPSYRARLQALGEDERKAQLDGDWNVLKGARFADFRTDLHVVSADDFVLPPPGTAPRAMGVDYGVEAPWVALWGVLLPDDLLVIYREVWATGLTPAEQAQRILDSEAEGERTDLSPIPTALDSACWTHDPNQPRARVNGRPVELAGPPRGSIADTYVRTGLPVQRSEKRRLESAAGIAARLKARPDGRPRLLILDTCRLLIETLPALQRDPKRPEDVTGTDDHAYDALRYLDAAIRTAGAPGADPVARFGPPKGPPPRPGVVTARGLRGRRF